LPLHLEKKAIRALGVAESFSPKDKFSTLAGVVMRTDLVTDGFAFGRTKVSGSDATGSIVDLFERLGRNDVNAILLSGSILSLYNLIDVDSLFDELSVPVIALTFRKSQSDLKRNIEARFHPKEAKSKIKILEKLGKPTKLVLRTGYPIFVRCSGIEKKQSETLLNRFTLQGAIPEPVRVARLLAKSCASFVR
jgi:endonuclease V-like protein UPF0215 family